MKRSNLIGISLLGIFVVVIASKYWATEEHNKPKPTARAVEPLVVCPEEPNKFVNRRDASKGPPIDRPVNPLFYKDYEPVRGPVFPQGLIGASRILVVVRENFYPAIKDAIDTYLQDLANDGYSPKLIQFSSTSQSETELKAILVAEHQEDPLEGTVMVGDLPIAMADKTICGTVESFPSDSFFMDLDSNGDWQDEDNNGTYELIPGGDKKDWFSPEIWVSRIHTSNLLRPDGSKLADDDASLITAYFARNHNFRIGPYVNQGLEGNFKIFKDDDFVMPVGQLTNAMYSNDRLDASIGYGETSSTVFLQSLKQPFDWFSAVSHGNESFFSFDYNFVYSPSVLTSQEVRDAVPQSYFVYLESCGPGRYTATDYLAGWFLFGYGEQPKGLFVLTHTDTFITKSLLPFSFMKKMKEGKSVGDAWLRNGDYDYQFTRVLLGDGALRPYKAINPVARHKPGLESEMVKLTSTNDPAILESHPPAPVVGQKPDLAIKDILFEYIDASVTPINAPDAPEGLETSITEGKWLRIKLLVQYLQGDKGNVKVGQYAQPTPVGITDVIGVRVKFGPEGAESVVAPLTKEVYLTSDAQSQDFGNPGIGLPTQDIIITSDALVTPLNFSEIGTDGISIKVEAELDPNNIIPEKDDTENNTFVTEYKTGDESHALPDLEIVDAGLYFSTFDIGVGALKKQVTLFTNISATVRNRGAGPINDQYKVILYGNSPDNNIFYTSTGYNSDGVAKRDSSYLLLSDMLASLKPLPGQEQSFSSILKVDVNPQFLPGSITERGYDNNHLEKEVPTQIFTFIPLIPIFIDP